MKLREIYYNFKYDHIMEKKGVKCRKILFLLTLKNKNYENKTKKYINY